MVENAKGGCSGMCAGGIGRHIRGAIGRHTSGRGDRLVVKEVNWPGGLSPALELGVCRIWCWPVTKMNLLLFNDHH